MLSCGAGLVQADVIGPVRMVDGDTLEVGAQRVRLFGIDAPETAQTCQSADHTTWACGAWAHARAAERFDGALARCEIKDVDPYDRLVARCWARGPDIGRWLVGEGAALAYRRYSKTYVSVEAQAKAAGIGLHSGRFERPAVYRVTRVNGRIPLDDRCPIKGNISRAGRIYHVPGQADYERTGIDLNKGERWFCSAQQARRAVWRAAKR